MSCLVRAFIVAAALVPATSAAAGPVQDVLVQPPTLAAPQRGSVAGSLSRTTFNAASLSRGVSSLPLGIEVPSARGSLLASVAPTYSTETGLTEWGMGWQAELSIQRHRVLGELDFQTDEFTSPWGKLVQGDDGLYYPAGLSALVRLWREGEGWVALTDDGTTYRFEAADAVQLPAGTYAWKLSRVQSLVGDSTTLVWTRNASGRSFLSSVSWGGRGDGTQYRLSLSYAILATPLTSYVAGAPQVLDRRVQRVEVAVKGSSGYATRWHYDLTYRGGTGSPAYYLTSIIKTYASGQTEPAVTYDYDLNAEQLAAARFAHVPGLDALIAAYGNRVLQPDRAATLDLEQDGLADLESTFDFTTFRQTESGFVVEPLAPEPLASPLCRPPPSTFNKPRALARMDGVLGEPHVVVARKLGFGGSTQLLVCDRRGVPLSDQTVLNNWELSATTRLVDVDRDRRPDLVRVSTGRISVLRNKLSPTQGVSWEPGPETLMSTQLTPLAVWAHDLNGDGNADLVIRHVNGIALWHGLGGGRFETVGRAAAFRLPSGTPLSGVADYEVSFGDYNGDGLADLVLSKGQSVGVFLNNGVAFVQAVVPGLIGLPFTVSYPVVSDLAATGDETIMLTDGARALALQLTRASTGLLRSVNDGKGTTLRFAYSRQPASVGAGRRPSVLAALTIESSGYDTVTHTYAYGAPVLHSVGQHLLGFSSVDKHAPSLHERVGFHHDDEIAGVVISSEQRDERTPGLLRFETSTFDERSFLGVRWLRPSQRKAGTRSEDGATELAVTTVFAAYEREHCPTVVVQQWGDSQQVETSGLAQVPALSDALHCSPAWHKVEGLHAEPALDFEHQVEIERNALGQPVRISQVAPGQPTLVMQEVSYDAWHRIATVAQPGRGVTSVAYDVLGRPRSVTDPLGLVTEVGAYDPVTELSTELRTHRPGAELGWFFSFDGKERLSAAWNDVSGGSLAQPLVRTTYQDATSTGPGRIDTTTLVDVAAGRSRQTISLVAADGEALATGAWLGTHAAMGQATLSTRASPAARTTFLGSLTGAELASLTSAELRGRGPVLGESVLSGFGRAVTVTATQQAEVLGITTTEVVLGAEELVTRVLQPGGHVAESAVDARGQVVRQTDELGVSHRFRYDAAGRLVRIETPDGVHRVELDGHGRPARVVREGLGSVSYAYDAGSGLLIGKQVLDADGAAVRQVTMIYDELGRPIASDERAGQKARTVSLEYDGQGAGEAALPGQLGHLHRLTGPGWAHTVVRDALGRAAVETWQLAGWRSVQVARTFFASGEVASETRTIEDAAGAVLSSTTREVELDALGRPRTILLNGAPLYTLGYDQENRLERADFATGEEVTFDYDPVTHARRGHGISSQQASGGVRWQLDPRGLVASETFTQAGPPVRRDYAYDGRRQLVAAAVGGTTSSYSYTASGLPATVQDELGARVVHRSGRTQWIGELLYTWDAAGRLIGKGEWSFSYGPSGQLETAQRPGRTVSYVYDEAGARLLKRVDGAPVRAEVGGGILMEDRFVELVLIGGVVVGTLDNGTFRALLTDPRGTPLVGADGEADLASAYGARQRHLGDAEVIDYARLGWDPDLDTVRMGVRDYDARLGQFWAPDPLYLESLEACARSPIDCNLYGYAKGNPLTWVDPSGTDPTPILLYIGIGKDSGDEASALTAQVSASGGQVVAIHGSASGNHVVTEGARTFDLATSSGIESFAAAVNMPTGLPHNAGDFVRAVEVAQAMRRFEPPMRDELARVASVFATAQRGEIAIERVVLSGHHFAGELHLHNDRQEELKYEHFSTLGKIYPRAVEGVKDTMLSACTSMRLARSEEYVVMNMFPKLDTIWAYPGSSPSTHQGAITHLQLWEKATRGKHSKLSGNEARFISTKNVVHRRARQRP